MGFFEKVRARSFWTFDALSGGIVKKHLNDLEKSLDFANGNMTKVVSNDNLFKLLNHTANTVPFYKDFDDNTLENFPVITKGQVVANYNAFYSNKHKKDDCVTRLTSGSTGEPFRVRQDKNKVKRNNADTIYFSKLVGYKIGYPLYFIRFWDISLRKSRLNAKLQNMYPFDVIDFDDSNMTAFCNELERKKKITKVIVAYSSVFDNLIYFLKNSKRAYDFSSVGSLIAISEPLSANTKKEAMQFFNVPIVSRYSNTENGIIAQQLWNSKYPDRFYINSASYFVEILDIESDMPIASGRLGRIVVTDLFNYAMPLIRYDTGDLGILNYDENESPYLERIEGRIMDAIYDSSGTMVSSFVPTHIEEYTGVLAYQFDQTKQNEYTISLVVNEQFKDEKAIIDFIKSHFGNDANVQVKYVDSIPLLASGKRKKVLNTFKNPIT